MDSENTMIFGEMTQKLLRIAFFVEKMEQKKKLRILPDNIVRGQLWMNPNSCQCPVSGIDKVRDLQAI